MSNFTTWAEISTYAGAIAATTILTQFIKNIPYVNKVNTQIISYVIAAALLICAEFVSGTFDTFTGILCAVNAAVVALASNGMYDTTKTGKVEAVPQDAYREDEP